MIESFVSHTMRLKKETKTKLYPLFRLVIGGAVFTFLMTVTLTPLAFAQTEDILDQNINSLDPQTGGIDSESSVEVVDTDELVVPELTEDTNVALQPGETATVVAEVGSTRTLLLLIVGGAVVVLAVVAAIRRKSR